VDIAIHYPSHSGVETPLISRTVEYALRAVLHLAAHRPNARTTEQISRGTKVPRPYLYKVLQALNREGIVVSQRGLGGGVSLERDPAQLTILAIINAVEPFQRIEKCPLGLAAHSASLCPLHRRLDNAMSMVEEAFRQSTIADLLAEPPTTVLTCKFPRPNPKPPKASGRAKRGSKHAT